MAFGWHLAIETPRGRWGRRRTPKKPPFLKGLLRQRLGEIGFCSVFLVGSNHP